MEYQENRKYQSNNINVEAIQFTGKKSYVDMVKAWSSFQWISDYQEVVKFDLENNVVSELRPQLMIKINPFNAVDVKISNWVVRFTNDDSFTVLTALTFQKLFTSAE